MAAPIDFARTSGALAERLAGYRDRVDRTIAPQDAMWTGDLDDYLGVGYSAVAQVAHAMAICGRSELPRILDFACGHGRVLRALHAAFPEAELSASDVDRDGVEFCARQFGALPLHSDPDPAQVQLVGPYDLIWVGSLFTHLDAEPCRAFLDLLRRNLAAGGLLLFSTHGRNAVKRWPRDDERTEAIVADFEREGFGYRDHYGVEGYGTSAFTAAWIANQLEPWTDLMLIGYMERGLADHQDVVTLLKTDVHHRQNELLVV
jgi:SAM-dependent methyltransferase